MGTEPLTGTPQGGIISPLLANITLAGLEKHVLTSFPQTYNVNGKRISTKIRVVRYADDFVVTCAKKAFARDIIKVINEFLKPRGLKLNKEKTKITNVKNGFLFLGFKFKLYEKGLLMSPSPDSVKRVKRKIKEVFRRSKTSLLGETIKDLNAILRGWANYYRVSSSTRAFVKVGHYT